MSRASRPLLVGLALTSVLGLAACGDKSLSKADYIAKVDPICKKYNDQLDKVPAPKDESDRKGLADYLNKGADIEDQQIKEIDDVGRPKEGKAQVDDFLNRQKTLTGQLRDYASAVNSGDDNKAQQIQTSADQASTKLDSDLKAFGFKVCGEES